MVKKYLRYFASGLGMLKINNANIRETVNVTGVSGEGDLLRAVQKVPDWNSNSHPECITAEF